MLIGEYANFLFQTHKALVALREAERGLKSEMDSHPLETALRLETHNMTNVETKLSGLISNANDIVDGLFTTTQNEDLWKQLDQKSFGLGEHGIDVCEAACDMLLPVVKQLPFYRAMYYTYVLCTECGNDWDEIATDAPLSTIYEVIQDTLTPDMIRGWEIMETDAVFSLIEGESESGFSFNYLTEGKLDLTNPDAVDWTLGAVSQYLTLVLVHQLKYVGIN